MTITTTKNRINQAADGVQLIFNYDFIVLDASHMNVYLDNVLQATGYTVNGAGDPAGGDVTFDVAPANGVTVTLQRVVPQTQLVDYLPYDPFPADTHEAALDKLTLIAQQLTDEINRAIKADVTVPEGVSYTLPLPTAGSFLQWNVDEDGFVNVHISDLGDFVATTPFTETLLDDADADEFWATLMATLEKTTARTLLDVYSKAEVDANDASFPNIPARNTVLTKDVLSQAGVSTPGFSAVLGIADDGIDGTNYLRWQKDKNNIQAWYQSDSVRGDFYSSSNTNAAEIATVPAINADDVSYQWDLNKTISGLTNRNKAYTTHYNPYLGVSVTGFIADGVDGHEIPHHLGVVPELTITKSRDSALEWAVHSSLFADNEYLYMNQTAALASHATMNVIKSATTIRLGSNVQINTINDDYIQYNFASVPGVSKIGKYIGTGADGNFVDCGFKAAFVMIRNLAVGNWTVADTMRGGDLALFANLTNAEAATYYVYSDVNGFRVDNLSTNTNVLNNQYLFIAFAETSIDAGKAVTNYTLPTNADQLAVVNPTLMTFANGFNSSGQVDVQEQIAGATLTYGAGHEDKKYYLYRDQGSAWGQSEVRPLIGLTRDTADYSGVVSPSDLSLRTTAHHFDYESETGIALASGERGTDYKAYNAFNKDNNDIITAVASEWEITAITTSWLQYKYTEKRILKSWRLRESTDQTRTPDRFTIEGSNDGLNWTEIDATYKTGTGVAFDTVTNGASLWSPLQDTSANTTAYFYHRINITENNAHATYTAIAELELNTKIASDYYLIDEAKMYNDAGTRLDRVYIGEALLDSAGDVISFINYAAAKQKLNEIEVHGKAVLHGELLNEFVPVAYGYVDGAVSPPLILNSKNILDVVNVGTGIYDILPNLDIDCRTAIIMAIVHTNSRLITQDESVVERSKNKLRMRTVLSTTSGAENRIFSFVIFGGKEIE